MRVCLLLPVLDAFKGANHLPLLSACSDMQFTVLCNRTKPEQPALPANVTVEALNTKIGPYYFGVSDERFANAVLHRYPVSHPFWEQFDAIHLNQTVGPALLQLTRSGVPVSLFIHHPVSADLEVALQESSFVQKIFWKLRYRMLIKWQRRAVHGFPFIATVSRTAAQRIAMDYDLDASKIHVVSNGVDGDAFVPATSARKEFDVVSIGSFIHPRKGFRYLVEAYHALASSGYSVADVGRRTEEQRVQLALIPGVQTFGMVEHQELLSILQRSKVLISTSLYEGFGLSLIEALACGIPAFAFDAGAVREVLDPVDPSLVSPLRDTSALVQKVSDFLHLSPDQQTAKGTQYRSSVLSHYPLQSSASQLQKLYKQMVASGQ